MDNREIDSVKKKLEKLKDQIRRADYRYYVLSDPEISDREYDLLLRKLEKIETRYPELVTETSPTQRVSGGLTKDFPPIKHNVAMLSLDKAFSFEELRVWQGRILKLLGRPEKIEYVVELKIDGVSCSLVYERGVLSLGSTRGDGSTGEDITANIKTIRSLSLKLFGSEVPERLEVRGEVFMEKKDFQVNNKKRLEAGESPFANPRNATSGSLKLLDPSMVSRRNLRCFIYSFGESKDWKFSSHKDFLDKAERWGLPLNPHNKLCSGLEEVASYCRRWQSLREKLSYEVDGVVVKVNDLALQHKLGQTLKSPRWAIAYKFPAKRATTVVKDVKIQVGRTGILTPVAVLEPVECGGAVISRATLHNFDEIERLGVYSNDTVLIERAGDVIPKIVKVMRAGPRKAEDKIKIPLKCPVCGGSVRGESEDEVYVYCLNNTGCPAQLKRAVVHFCSRPAMDIEGLGKSLAEELVEKKLVTNLGDIYRLKKEELLNLPLFADKKASNLLKSIELSKKRGLSRFVYALGIKHVGEKAARTLAERFPAIEAFFSLDRDELEEIDEIGPVMARAVVDFFSQKTVKDLVSFLKSTGMVLEEEKKETGVAANLKGKTFVFTGELLSLTRRQAKDLVEERGGVSVNSVSKNTDFVVAGEKPGSKYQKARKLNLPIIDEKAFLRITRGDNP
ncbi:MAG: NAD-dependent DNA ligase LigA [Candidatus Omnitrophica bacterium]|nr:NAD-dependent DNA ligase LigA [Candidatus Omnitrophota bacterium]MBD3269849.1 NAD-dependent DNA ligase LigA [Candidatus Omnitrophota bacterium]